MSRFVNEYKLQCYKIMRSLGELDSGNKENIWLAEDMVTGKHVVMRRLSADCREVYARLKQICHPNLVQVSDAFVQDGSLYVIEEYLDWQLLSDWTAKKRPSAKQVIIIGWKILSALSALHEHGLVHRDIKPENIMINDEGSVKIIDFDIARLFSGEQEKDTSAKGSRGYAPPEQFGFAQSDCRTDLYAFGVTLNELATGELPQVKKCSGRLGIITRKCMQLDPEKRYQSADQALKHIELLFQKLPRLAVSGVLVLCLTLGTALFLDQWMPHFSDPQVFMDDLSQNTPYPDRIIAAKTPQDYPAVLMSEDRKWGFIADAGEQGSTEVTAEKKGAHLTLACCSENGKKAVFEFDDVCFSTYEKLGYSINTEFEKTSPEYEILRNDFNGDGKQDFLVTLAWRCRVNTPEEENRYYLTEYSTLWLVYRDGQGRWNCSEPLYFEGCEPTLQTDTLLYDSGQPAWYSFKKEKWHVFY